MRSDEQSTEKPIAAFSWRVLLLIMFAALALLLWQWRHVLLLAFASVLIACGLRGVASPLRRVLPLGEGWSVALALLLIVAALAGLGWLFGSQLSAQASVLMDAVPQAAASLEKQLAQFRWGRSVVEQLRASSSGSGLFANFAERAARFSMSFSSAALDGLIVLVAAIFLALQPKAYRDGALKLVPQRVRSRAREALDLSGKALKKWLLGTLFSMAAMSLMVTLGLWTLGVPAALALGLLSGIAQFVPFVGPILAAVPGVLLAYTVSPMTALWAVLLFFGATTIEANILYPLIQKRAVEQPPVITLYTIIAFGLLFGGLGVLLAVPLTVVISVFVVLFYVRGALGEDMKAPGE